MAMAAGSQSGSSPLPRVGVSPREVVIEPQPFNISGHFGDIFRGRHPEHGVVALKRLRTGSEDDNTDRIRRFFREAETWQALDHRNILPCLGIGERDDHIYLISPYAEHGTVVDYLKRNPSSNRRKFLLEIAMALAFLHSKYIVHGDVKGRNVLVSPNFSAQVCDFGLARHADTATSAGMKGAGSTRWMSPEVLDGNPKSSASDVYAFGVTVAEVLSGKLPFSQYDGDAAVITAVLIRGERPPRIPLTSADGSLYDAEWDIAERCWAKEVDMRPSMDEVVRRLGGDKSPSIHVDSELRSSHLREVRPSPREVNIEPQPFNDFDSARRIKRESENSLNWRGAKIQVAVKKLRFDGEIDQDRTSKAFVRELGVLNGLNHPKVANLVGFVEDLERNVAWLVSSWEPNGNVREFLMSAKCTIPERISLIRDTLEGLLYLHTRETPICNGDLKSFNILVNATYKAFITDFGSARLIKRESENSLHPSLQTANDNISATDNSPELVPNVSEAGLTLTNAEFSFRWAAPEVLMGDRPNLPSDIWAAAWTCWEILTDELPFSNTNSEGAITLGIIEGKVPISIQGEHMSQIRDLFRLMTACWAIEPSDRPSAEDCLEEVRRLPSNIPSSPTRLGFKIHSTFLSRHPAQIRYLTSDFKRAKSIHRSALDFARSTEDQLAAANTLFRLGGTYHARRKYQLAEEAYIHAQVYYASAGNLAGRARAFEELGGVYGAQCLYGNAESSYLRAKTMYTCLKDDLGRAGALCGLGDVYRARCKYKEAEEFYQEARCIYARSAEDRGRANALLGLGEVYSARYKYKEAEEFYQEARGIHARSAEDRGRANALLGLGEARDMCGDDLARANAWGGLGDVYRGQNKYDEADEAYRAAYILHTKARDEQA